MGTRVPERLRGVRPGSSHDRVTAAQSAVVQHGAIRGLASAIGNRAARRTLVVDARSPASAATAARVAWKDEAGFKKTKSDLTTQQAAGVTAAVASPNAKPASVTTWVEARVKLEMDYATTLTGLGAAAQKKATDTWDTNKAKILAKDENATKNPDDVKRDWIASIAPTMATAERRKLDNKVKTLVGNRMGELKWNDAFNNSDGFLPGDKGAGGYGEYYAEPAPSDAPSSGFWGQNRVLHGTDGWFVTADHYKNFVKVTDA